MNILNQLNSHFTAKKGTPTTNVWESMGMDKHLRPEVAQKRKATEKFMDEIYDDLIPYINRCEMPFWIIPKV